MAKLILVRHGETVYNRQGVWTGLTEVNLTHRGRKEAGVAGKILAPIRIDIIFISKLKRTAQTARPILRQQAGKVPIIATPALNERNYGIFTGQNKQQVLREKGEEEFLRIRRSWDGEIEGGETLQEVHRDRIAPFHREVILPRLSADETILVISSNNALRAYVKELEDIPVDLVADIVLGTGELRVYDFDSGGAITGKTVHQVGEVH